MPKIKHNYRFIKSKSNKQNQNKEIRKIKNKDVFFATQPMNCVKIKFKIVVHVKLYVVVKSCCSIMFYHKLMLRLPAYMSLFSL